MAAILLDTSVIGIISNPKVSLANTACNLWLSDLLTNKARVIIPGIADYELRRELILHNKINGLKRLDQFCSTLEFLILSPEALRYAADLWAKTRKMGITTADPKALDADMILAAQALLLGEPAIVATSNVAHLDHLVTAKRWQDIAVATQ